MIPRVTHTHIYIYTRVSTSPLTALCPLEVLNRVLLLPPLQGTQPSIDFQHLAEVRGAWRARSRPAWT